ncbi:hypothetical protein BOX15_Mlig016087g2 [Macrostomum lignano]|uniref:Adenosine 3'-phospho 5'-phosphosulfate transporter 1 n=1 Tax=Macrostomum lignano TaxID=282301 RepID=A0A267E4N7_9PLAT|nr:hypothetical protein BOX15_Mlig016087g2 [Macrostomum lignano]
MKKPTKSIIASLSLGQVHTLVILAFAASAIAAVAPWRWLNPLPTWLIDTALLAELSALAAELKADWPVRFLANLIGYASSLLPLYFVLRLVQAWGYDRRGPSRGILPSCIRTLALPGGGAASPKDDENDRLGAPRKPSKEQQQKQKQQHQSYSLRWCLHLTACFLGLQAAYLTWGLLQERMTTFDYNGERFRDSQFLVFVNRALGGLLALPLMLLAPLTSGATRKSSQTKASDRMTDGKQSPPAFEYVYSSVSNILSSWCQYEALVYVTFPTQVLAKASKIIPVMLMGRLVSRKSYRVDEYFTAGLISGGTALFLLSSPEVAEAPSSPTSTATNPTSATQQQWMNAVSGATLLAGYLMFDAFTSSWQSKLFASYRSGPIQMLAGSSLASCLATVTAQLQQGSLVSALGFAYRQPLFASHLGLLALCSTLGQLVIFHTIDSFGPVTFTIIMTVRQGFAILISSVVYQHRLSGNAWCGVGVVFAGCF